MSETEVYVTARVPTFRNNQSWLIPVSETRNRSKIGRKRNKFFRWDRRNVESTNRQLAPDPQQREIELPKKPADRITPVRAELVLVCKDFRQCGDLDEVLLKCVLKVAM